MKNYWSKYLGIIMMGVFVFIIAACSEEEPASSNNNGNEFGNDSEENLNTEDDENGELTFGYIAYDMTDVWNMYSAEAFEYAGEQKGVETIILDSENDLETSVQQMESLIQSDVDGISIFPITPDQAVTLSNMANDAGIPVTFENVSPSESVGDYISVIAAEYDLIGEAAFEFIAETWPGSEVLFVAGAQGGGVYEEYQDGIDRALETVGDQVEVVDIVHGDWETELAMNVTQSSIQSGREFDVVFANNELMAKGVTNALIEAGLDEDVKIVSTGGGPDGMGMIENGELTATMSAPVSLQGLITFRNLYQYINGDTPEKHSALPIVPITADTLNEAISWEVDDNAVDFIGGLD